MTYRDDREALRARVSVLEERLAELKESSDDAQRPREECRVHRARIEELEAALAPKPAAPVSIDGEARPSKRPLVVHPLVVWALYSLLAGSTALGPAACAGALLGADDDSPEMRNWLLGGFASGVVVVLVPAVLGWRHGGLREPTRNKGGQTPR